MHFCHVALWGTSKLVIQSPMSLPKVLQNSFLSSHLWSYESFLKIDPHLLYPFLCRHRCLGWSKPDLMAPNSACLTAGPCHPPGRTCRERPVSAEGHLGPRCAPAQAQGSSASLPLHGENTTSLGRPGASGHQSHHVPAQPSAPLCIPLAPGPHVLGLSSKP